MTSIVIANLSAIADRSPADIDRQNRNIEMAIIPSLSAAAAVENGIKAQGAKGYALLPQIPAVVRSLSACGIHEIPAGGLQVHALDTAIRANAPNMSVVDRIALKITLRNCGVLK